MQHHGTYAFPSTAITTNPQTAEIKPLRRLPVQRVEIMSIPITAHDNDDDGPMSWEFFMQQ